MLSHRDIIRALRTTLKALPEHPHACDVVAAPGSGTRTIVIRDSRGRPLLTVSALAAVYAPAVPGREQRTLDEVAPRPELPAVPPLAVDPTAPGFRIMRVGDLVFAPDRATWEVGEITRATDHGAEGEIVRLDLGTRCVVVDRAEITLDAADLWGCAKLPTIAVATVRVWIAEGVWDALPNDTRDTLAQPDVDSDEIAWSGRAGWVFADVSERDAATLRAIFAAQKIKHFEGEEPPVKRAKKTAPATAPTAAQVAAHEVACERVGTEPVLTQPAPVRALIVHDGGADSLGARKGLHAWSAEKTPGAGSQSGGDLAPLVMLWTPATDSPDVAKLLARYAKVNRPVLDLGVIAGADRHALAPFQPEVRARWNAAHPAHRVSVPEAKKTARKGGAK